MRSPAYKATSCLLAAALTLGLLPCYASAEDGELVGGAYVDAGYTAGDGVSAVVEEASQEADSAEVDGFAADDGFAVGDSDADNQYTDSGNQVTTDADGNTVITYPETDVSGETVKDDDGSGSANYDDEIETHGRSGGYSSGDSGGGGGFSGGGRGGGSFSGGSTVHNSVNSGFSAMVTGLGNIASNTYGIGQTLTYVVSNTKAIANNTNLLLSNTHLINYSVMDVYDVLITVKSYVYSSLLDLGNIRNETDNIYNALTNDITWGDATTKPLNAIVGCYVQLKAVNDNTGYSKKLYNLFTSDLKWGDVTTSPIYAIIGIYSQLVNANAKLDGLTTDIEWGDTTTYPLAAIVGSYVQLKGISSNTYYGVRLYNALISDITWADVTTKPLNAIVGCYYELKQILDAVNNKKITLGDIDLTDLLNAVKANKPNDYSSKLSDILTAVKANKPNDYGSKLSDLLTAVKDGFKSVVDAINNKKIEVKQDTTSDADSSASFWDALLGALDMAKLAAKLDNLGTTLKSSFPFGLVFFLVSTLAVFSASPVTPSWSGSFMGTDFNITLSQFDGMAALCRALLLGLYVFGLYSGTKSWLFGGSDGD